MKYENRIIVFLDIIGFKSLVASGSDDKKLHRIMNYLNHQQKASVIYKNYELIVSKINEDLRLKGEGDIEADIEITLLSDSFVISLPVEHLDMDLFTLFIQYIAMLQCYLAADGIFTRGGISIGDLYHKSGIMYGPAMIEAYILESELANYFRVLIDKTCLMKILKSFNKELEEIDLKQIRSIGCSIKPASDMSDMYVVDYLDSLIINTSDKDYKEIEDLIYSIQESIISEFNAVRDDRELHPKYYWMKNYYNDSISDKIFENKNIGKIKFDN